MNFLMYHLSRRSLSQERKLRDRLNPLEAYDAAEFHKLFRFSKESILHLVNNLDDKLTDGGNRTSLNSIQRVCIALRFYATGEMQLSLAAWINVDQTTVSRTCWEVTNAIIKNLTGHVQWPSSEDTTRIKRRFHERHDLPMIIGCIDCTHVRIQAPKKDQFPDEYINRKGYHSINVQAICDDRLRFFDAVAEWPGRTR